MPNLAAAQRKIVGAGRAIITRDATAIQFFGNVGIGVAADHRQLKGEFDGGGTLGYLDEGQSA